MRTRLKAGAIERARELRAQATDAERKLWYKLRELKAHGYHFRRQAPFRSYTLDFVEHSRCLIVELDGGQHGEEQNQQRDAIRDRVVRNQGYRVLRFWNLDVLKNLDAVVETILRALADPPPDALRASTSPQGGGKLNSSPLPLVGRGRGGG